MSGRVDVEAKFWQKVDRRGVDDCWEWLGGTNNGGYGRLWPGGRHVLAHRFAYEFARGPIPVGLELDHLCRNRRCVNPAHLEPVDNRTNVLRGVGITAVNAAKTHCVRGHLFDEANTYVRNGWRTCRECKRLREARRRRRQREMAA